MVGGAGAVVDAEAELLTAPMCCWSSTHLYVLLELRCGVRETAGMVRMSSSFEEDRFCLRMVTVEVGVGGSGGRICRESERAHEANAGGAHLRGWGWDTWRRGA